MKKKVLLILEIVFLVAFSATMVVFIYNFCANYDSDKHEHTVVVDEAVAATCTEDGLTEGSHCSECGEIIVAQEVVPALGHTVVYDSGVAATCTESGLTSGSHCSVCGEILNAQNIILAKGHTAAEAVIENEVTATCTEDGSYDSVVYCSVCGAEISRETVVTSEAEGHSWNDGEITTEATATENGVYTYTCSVCGETKTEEIPYTGSEGLSYSPYSYGYSVSGIGTCEDTDIVIPEVYNGLPVIAISEGAFQENEEITSVSIPDSVVFIDGCAFDSCTALKSITIPSSVSMIGNRAFTACRSLESIDVDSDNTSYKSIDGNLYSKDGKVLLCCAMGKADEFTIPESVTSIGAYAFQNYTSLTSITIPESVTSIGTCAFQYCTSLTSITIPESVTSIGYGTFQNCTSLTSITFENTEGWYVTTTSGATSGTDLTSEDLSDTSTAVTYLTSTYYNYYWHRSE